MSFIKLGEVAFHISLIRLEKTVEKKSDREKCEHDDD